MKTNLKQTFILLIAGVIVLGGIVLAGSLTPTTSTPEATYVSLNDVYDKLTTGATTTEKSFTPTVGTDTATMHTLSEIFDVIPEWLTLDNSTTTVPAGYYEATDLAVEDEDLIADNILDTATIFGITGTASVGGGGGTAGLPVTGQTVSYADYDDGDYEAGLPSSGDRFTDNGDGTITDNGTGLEWVANPTDAGVGATYNWTNAIAACEGLSYAGHSDWRLPNIRELFSLLDYSNGEADPLFEYQPSPYWSSTTHHYNFTGANAWYVDFISDYKIDDADKTDLHYVGPVRGGI